MAFWWRKNSPVPDGSLTERVESLERRMKHLVADWDETFEKLTRANAKLAKRQKALAELEDAQPSAEASAEVMDPATLRAVENGRMLLKWRGARGA